MVIAVSNQKGGVNKTTLTFNLGYLLAEQDKRILVIDADPQGSLTTIFGAEDHTSNIYNTLLENTPVMDSIVEIDNSLHLLVGGIELANFDVNVAAIQGRENYFKRMIEDIRNKYDYVIIDSPPSLGLLLINILNASDKVLIPTQTDYLSYKGLDLLLHTIAKVKDTFNNNLEILGVVATGFDGRTLHSKEILELIEGMNVLGIITNSVKVKDATLASEPLHRYDKNHKIVKEYKKIAQEVLKYD